MTVARGHRFRSNQTPCSCVVRVLCSFCLNRTKRAIHQGLFFIYVGGNNRQTGLRFNLMTFLDSGLMEARGLLLHSRRVYLIVTRMLGQTLGVDKRWLFSGLGAQDNWLLSFLSHLMSLGVQKRCAPSQQRCTFFVIFREFVYPSVCSFAMK